MVKSGDDEGTARYTTALQQTDLDGSRILKVRIRGVAAIFLRGV